MRRIEFGFRRRHYKDMKRFDLPKILFILFLIVWVFLGWKPLFRAAWVYENIVIFLGVPIVIFSYFRFRLSNRAYVLIFIFAILHIAAAHYTYGETPWGKWMGDLFGWERNHYDRVVHFLYGALLAGVALELIDRKVVASTRTRKLFAFAAIVAMGTGYEIGEFLVGIVAEPDAGLAFLGFQGDIWDTQKDMALQALGALMGLVGYSRFYFYLPYLVRLRRTAGIK